MRVQSIGVFFPPFSNPSFSVSSLRFRRRGLSSEGNASDLIKSLKSAICEGVGKVYGDMKVPQLRENCTIRGLDARGRKSDLVVRLMDDLIERE